MRLLDAVDLRVDESPLTGETKPVRKTMSALERGVGPELAVAERKNCAYMGTLVRSGYGVGVVVGTGKSTEFGAIFLLMKEVRFAHYRDAVGA